MMKFIQNNWKGSLKDYVMLGLISGCMVDVFLPAVYFGMFNLTEYTILGTLRATILFSGIILWGYYFGSTYKSEGAE